MPELPEVETIRRELTAAILDKKITGVMVHDPRVIREPLPQAFVRGLTGVAVSRILRKGKLLIWELSSGKSLAIHLKMTGQLIYPGAGNGSRVSFRLDDGKLLDFNDQRLFAELRLVDDWRLLSFVQGLGPEPSALSPTQFNAILAARKTKIKPLLMDQKIISGIGNLYAAEALFRAGVHPERPAMSLSDKEKQTLFTQIKLTLDEAIRFKGSSVDAYVRLTGQPGGYVAHHRVYERQGKPCPVCGAPIRKMTLAGRGTCFCPRCQK